MEEEEWRRIAAYPRYRVSNLGRVRSPYGKILLPTGKQRTVSLYNKYGQQHTASVAYLVATAFVDGRTNGKTRAIHKDGNYDNNAASNLEWVSTDPAPPVYKVEVFKDGALIKTFPSTNHAARKYKVPAVLISYACHRGRTIEQLPGLYFRYAPEEEE